MNTVTIPNSSTLDLRLAITMASRTSSRSAATLDRLSGPWVFAAKHTYDAETNPEGMISFALAENVCELNQLIYTRPACVLI
jgi:hypothetical protein